ncbi:MAG: hypothetical protein R3183_03530 [Oleiphilaceae bacterium]|nr:hypothetical protein [Oleiphilaceae bacterium]
MPNSRRLTFAFCLFIAASFTAHGLPEAPNAKQQKQQRCEDAGIDPLFEASLGDLLLQKQIELPLSLQHDPAAAERSMLHYCMQFSVKAHYYPDALISELDEYPEVADTDT